MNRKGVLLADARQEVLGRRRCLHPEERDCRRRALQPGQYAHARSALQ